MPIARCSKTTWAMAAACFFVGCAAHPVRRAATVPAITPPLITGQPIDNGRSRLTVANSTFLKGAAPLELSEASNTGLYIPRSQFGFQALFRIGRDMGMGVKMELGLEDGAEPVADQIPDQPSGPTVGLGPLFQYSIPIFDGFRIGLEFETLLFFCPYVKYTIMSYDRKETGIDPVIVLGLAAVPSYRWGPLTVFAGVSGRNQPTNTKSEIQHMNTDIFEDDNEVHFGVMYLTVFGGAQVRLWNRLDLTAQLYYPITDDPISYGGPALAVWLSVTLGSPYTPRRRPPPPRHPPPPRYQPAPPPATTPPPAMPAPPARHPAPAPMPPEPPPAA